MEEMMITTTAFIRGEAAAVSKKKGHASWKPQDQSKRHSSDKRPDFRVMAKNNEAKYDSKLREIAFPQLTASNGTEGPLVIEAEMGGQAIHRMYIDGGSSMEILYEHCFNRLWPEINSQMVPATTSLTGFSGDATHSTKAWMNFMVVKSMSPYNGIIGRPGLKAIQAVPSTVHEMLKFPVEGGIATIRSTILIPTECASVITSSVTPREERTRPANFTPSDMTGVPRSVAKHRLNIREGYTPVRQKKMGQAPERARAIQAETLKKCIKKSDFRWAAEAEQAFQQLKQHLSELPLLVGPNPQKELIMYLSATYRAVSAVLMTKKGTTQMPIYFISRVLQGPLHADYIMREIHEGSCSMHAGPRSVVAKAIRLMYYWPTMHKDARVMIRKCNDCQIHRPVTRHPQQSLTPITAPWPFYKWGIDITGPFSEGPGKVKFLIVAMDYFTKWIHRPVTRHPQQSLTPITAPWPFYKWGIDITGPFSEGPGKVKFLIVAMDYFTKWVKAKAVATITGEQVKKFVWNNIVCRFEIGMPTYRTAAVDVVNNDKELRLNLDMLEERRERAAICEDKANSKMMKYYNARVRDVAFKPGDFVYRSNDASHAVAGGKLGPKWEGPYEVTEELGNKAYKLWSTDGTVLPRTWNVTNLKRCYL
nr:hypothetical protein [Tanacetum cinerariifolium]